MDNDTLVKLASMFCPKCFGPTKLRESQNGNFRLYCRRYTCEMTAWYPTEMEAREALVKKSAEILGVGEK